MKIIGKSIKYLFICIILVSILCALAFLFIKSYDDGKYYNIIFEQDKPQIILSLDSIKGIGIENQELIFKILDEGAGLDEYSVSLDQKNRHIPLEKKKLHGEKEKEIKINLGFQELKLTEGMAQITIKAFDKSFWNNHKEISFNLEVDARYPKLKVITTQHNLLLNGVQLVVYQAYDDNLKMHGVKLGKKFFQGFPISLLDSSIKDSSVYGVFYSVLEDDDKSLTPIVIARDSVGNEVTKTFYNKKIKRRIKDYNITITPYFNDVISKRFKKQESEDTNAFLKKVLYDNREKESKEIFEVLHDVIFKINLKLPFTAQKSSLLKNFGSSMTYIYNANPIFSMKEQGATFSLSKDEKSINAISDGTVIFVKEMQYYGNVVAVSHGGSIVALYAMGGTPLVKSGDKVTLGQGLMEKGNSGVSTLDTEYLLEIRVNGYPVNPQEFFDGFWCNEHIINKITLTKEDLGLVTPSFDY